MMTIVILKCASLRSDRGITLRAWVVVTDFENYYYSFLISALTQPALDSAMCADANITGETTDINPLK